MDQTKLLRLLKNWHIRIRATHKGHYKDAAALMVRQRILGISVVLLTSFVGTGLFVSLTTSALNENYVLIGGLISATASILAALQTYLNYPERQTTHLIAATQLSSLKKRIEEKLATEEDVHELKVFIREIRVEWNTITSGAPLMSEKNFNKNAAVTDEYFQVD